MTGTVATAGTLRILYFAWLRERVGTSEETVALPATVTTVGELMAWLQTRGPGHAAAFAAGGTVRCAVNQDFAHADAAVRPGDEVAFFPPVTGG
ncbi:molybdopterin converting factor subunit 1 [Limobrevibacterium gyesilva]|uniref:Molybdopterin synthase sulfur carrier subunit n=1 Tax=Limobrevibacterium gyesilva TaxID=2991712 RepID=A0AA42CIK5_9PROT|nr:molybdopterin converting factor subunit 1 [Limobrevibacterium gyesilva]MCW3476012.1 molybdopterin converting factor subunit 1 [Limobrevibacterium gyesilva]